MINEKKLSVKPSEYIEIKQHGLVYVSAASGDFWCVFFFFFENGL